MPLSLLLALSLPLALCLSLLLAAPSHSNHAGGCDEPNFPDIGGGGDLYRHTTKSRTLTSIDPAYPI